MCGAQALRRLTYPTRIQNIGHGYNYGFIQQGEDSADLDCSEDFQSILISESLWYMNRDIKEVDSK